MSETIAVQPSDRGENAARRGPPVNLEFQHIGLCTMNLEEMAEFYTGVLGMTVTDRGHEADMDLVFLSRDPQHHHQIVLCTGRPVGLPQNAHNPMFGPIINQISFQLGSLEDLQAMNAFLDEAYPQGNRFSANHGNTWSVYVSDPEGNLVELYADSPWFCSQPMMLPLDLTQSTDTIMAETEVISRGGGSFMPHDQWHAEIAKRMRPH